MRHFIVILFLFVVSVFLGIKMTEDPGYAFFSYQQWSVEMPLWLTVIATVLVFFVGYMVGHLLDSIDSTWYRWKNWLRLRRKDKSYNKTNRGLVDLVEGDWKNAEYYLLEGVPQSDAALINYLAAAYAAHERGAYDKRDMYLRKAHDVSPHAEVAIGLTQAQLQLKQGQLEQALATLRHLRSIVPKHKVVLKLLERVYVHLADWQELLNLLPNLRKAKLLNEEQAQQLEKKIYHELLIVEENKTNNASEVRAVWNAVPKKWQKDPALICCYTKKLLPYPDTAVELEALLSSVIKVTWNKELVNLYGLIAAPDPAKQLAKASKWLKDYPNQAVLLLTLGRLSMRCQLWGKARNYYESSLKLETNPDAYMEYGKLLEQLNELPAAIQNYKDGLLLCAK